MDLAREEMSQGRICTVSFRSSIVIKKLSSHAREQGDEIEKGGSAGALDRNQIDDAIMTMTSVYSSMRNPKVMKQGGGRGDR